MLIQEQVGAEIFAVGIRPYIYVKFFVSRSIWL